MAVFMWMGFKTSGRGARLLEKELQYKVIMSATYLLLGRRLKKICST